MAPFFTAMPTALWETPPAARAWSADLLTDIHEYQHRIGGRGALRGDEVAVVTGQQAGFMTGPLYTIYKAVTSIRLARELEARFSVPHAPVFWVHEDDHDFQEVAAATLLTKQHELLELRYVPAADVVGRPVNRVPIEASLHALVDEAAHAGNGSEWREDIRSFLHEALDASTSYSDWMVRIMARLFQGTPLVLFSPALPAARRIAASVFARELENPTAAATLAHEAETALAAHGYSAQVSKRDDECAFFLLVEGHRRKVEFHGGQFVLPEENVTMSVAEMKGVLADHPERFSANVLLRGVVQQVLLPASAYVAGPGEIAYWAQLRKLFAHHGVAMPVVYPRARAVLTTMKLRKLCAGLGVTLDDLLGNPDDMRDRVLRRLVDSPEMRYLRDRRADVEAPAGALAVELESMSPVAGSMGAGLRRAIGSRLDRMERVLSRQHEDTRDAIEKRLRRVQNSLAPDRKHQERVLNVFSFLFSYGWELIPKLVQELDVDSFTMQEIEL